ncbi:WD-repeat protein WDR6, WD repeat superfamily [Phytophthora cinnamomi]|uniref:WD-repeat protein WDR6, WD repeat superfamily n=1 Tax=Phytophthora cinnamomi TaxID=4785 RepID=UPI003559C90C|nr:WD-repeat protein WDR6, WD repeat superfamily [Phytophthora cinnamomi]
MAYPPIKKQEFLGAVTLVTFSADGSLLYVGVGPTVFLYATATGELLGEHKVLTRGILHGCDVVGLPDSCSATTEAYVGAFFGQKRVACFKNLPQTPEAARGLDGLTVLGKPKVFCDWVFDVQQLTDDFAPEEANKTLLAAVGLAHNLVQIWDPVRNDILRSVQCAERCILYALAFHGRSLDELVVASGTVFQQILLWNPMENANEDSDCAVEPVQRLHAHDGVLFKLAWSSDARALASVSDDRTVQLWSNNGETTVGQLHAPRTANRAELLAKEYSPVFRAWGHSARIWDVCFWERGLVTASEDGLCKLWDLDGKCVATLQGHMGRHVWRAAVHPSQKVIATGGGDGAAKLWDITRQLMSTSDVPDSSDWSKTIRVSFTTSAIATKKKKGSQSHSVRNIVLSARNNGKTAFVASEHGEIFLLDLSSLTAQLFFTIPPIDDTPVQTRTGGLSTFAIDGSGRFLLLGDVSGRVCVVDATTGNLLHSWVAHANVRVMKIWWEQDGTLFVSSASGILSEWKPSIAETKENSTVLSIEMELAATFKIPAKSSTSSILVLNRSGTRNIIGGDGHGSVYIFHRPLATTEKGEDVSVPRSPALVLKGVHGRELVASLLLSDGAGSTQGHHTVMFSGGHDGYICSFTLEENGSGALTAAQVGRESIRGISTIKQLWWSSPSSGDNTKSDLMVLGFHAAHAVLHNFSAQYRVFNVECGGWRRPHALFTSAQGKGSSLPSHTFVFTPPSTQKQQVDIKEDEIAGVAVGSTDGLVTLWDLSALLKNIGSLLQSKEDFSLVNTKLLELIGCMRPSGNYLAHDMGTNCINLVKCTKSEEQGSLDVTLISGGDDQNLSLQELRFPACQKLSEARAVNASGSAIKTVGCVDAQVVFVAGYDQRVSKWTIRRDRDGTQLEWRGAAFSECADIADLAIRQAPTAQADEVVVVGQGLQMLQFQRE